MRGCFLWGSPQPIILKADLRLRLASVRRHNDYGEKCAGEAERLNMPYEQARALLELGRSCSALRTSRHRAYACNADF